MSKKRILIHTRGGKNGQCNICGDEGSLTEDHSPPKSCVKPRAVQIRHIVDLLAGDGVELKGKISQNGVKFKTLCSRCNNDLLGLRYDPALASFTNKTADILSSSLKLPNVITIMGNPQRIMRAVVGHLAAQGVGRYLKGPETTAIRDSFLDESIPLPENIRIYYWPFPHHGCVLFRDASYLDVPTSQIAVIWLMKFFPISFMVAWEKTDERMFNLPCLSEWRTISADKEVELPLRLTHIPQRYWPEAPSDRSVIVYGREAMFSVPYAGNIVISN